MYAFADAFDRTFTLKHHIEKMLERKVALRMFIDSKSLFDVITKCLTTSERRLMIGI